MKDLLRRFLDFPEPVAMALVVAGVMFAFWILSR